ncbi:MAG TPA: hypothetical protein VHV51_22020 [Polyangiaceae bacterium]|nr:hypothetical protein [Polyangiaceae bacterium]
MAIHETHRFRQLSRVDQNVVRQSVARRGSWFPEAFEGPISNLQRFVAGEDAQLLSSIDDAYRTMALVEACYQSSEQGGTPIPD